MPVLRKVLRAIATTMVGVTLVFVAMRSAGDPALEIFGPDTFSQSTIDAYRAQWGLDRPVWEQYRTYLANAVTGDLGVSFVDGRPALAVVAERLPNTLVLMGASFLLMLVIGVPAGVWAALHRNRWSDTAISAAAVTCHSLPNFFLGMLLILVFSVWLQWLPVGGAGGIDRLILPAIAFGASGAGVFARFARAGTLDVLQQPYVIAARARGLSERDVVVRHVLPNAALPLVTIIGLTAGGLIAGSVVVETVFGWPGVGRLLVTSAAHRDLAVVQVIVLLVIVSMTTANLLVDLAYGWLDPRIRRSAGRAS